MRAFAKIFIFAVVCGLSLSGILAHAEELMTWEECISIAKENNPNLLSAGAFVNQQGAQKRITISNLLPQVDGTANAAKSKNEGNSSVENYSYGVSGSQLLFDGFNTINQVKGANENLRASKEGYQFTSSDVRFNLRAAFVNLLKSQEMIRVAEENIKIRKDNLRLITLRYKSGLEHKGAMMKAEANLSMAQYDLDEAKRGLETAQWQLTEAMGRREFSSMMVRGNFTIKENIAHKPDYEALAGENPSLKEAAAKTSSASYGVKSAYGAFSPQLSAIAGADRASNSWPPSTTQLNAGVGLTVPIFEGGVQFAQLSKAKAALHQASENERGKKDKILVTLQQSFAAFKDAVENVGVQRNLLEAAEMRSKISDAQYSTGFTSFDNWIIIEDELVRAKKAYLIAEAQALLAEAKWIYAKGGTLEYAQ